MTVYVARSDNDLALVGLWGDVDDEAWGMAVVIGADLANYHDDRFVLFMVTPEQRLAALRQGAQPTDWLGPAYFHAMLGGEVDRLVAFDEYRARWHTLAHGRSGKHTPAIVGN